MMLEHALVVLASKIGSSSGSIEVTTAELGRLLGVSQQTASRYVVELAGKGWVERVRSGRGYSLRLSGEGVSVLQNIHTTIGRFLDSRLKQSYEGTVVSGIGEGAYYVGEYAERIRKAVGYRPYAGTLNVRIGGGRPNMNTPQTLDVLGFMSHGRSFGRVGLTPVKLHIQRKTISCHVIIPERTHHKVDLEVIAKENLRDKYGLKDGEKARIMLV